LVLAFEKLNLTDANCVHFLNKEVGILSNVDRVCSNVWNLQERNEIVVNSSFIL